MYYLAIEVFYNTCRVMFFLRANWTTVVAAVDAVASMKDLWLNLKKTQLREAMVSSSL